jgi:hypothetical protein
LQVDGKVLSIELAASNARKSRREAETETPVAKQASRFVQAATSARRYLDLSLSLFFFFLAVASFAPLIFVKRRPWTRFRNGNE